MTELTAPAAARLARDIYEIVEIPNIDLAVRTLKKMYGESMHLSSSDTIKAKTGGPAFIKSRTAFGLCTLGKGVYQGHAFIILRGTRFLADWLTNLNVGTSRSSFGQSIHDGFHQAFRSMQMQLKPFIAQLASRGVHSIHCIGHSLGGALATVCAEYITASTSFKPYLYTFGSPRVGMRPFADMLSSNMGAARMFRVYHRTDIVPCIPFWPFIHTPTLLSDTYDYFQPSPGQFPGGKWHDMDLYIATVSDHKWALLRNRANTHYDNFSIEHWINKKGPVSFSVSNLAWLDKAINYVLGKFLGLAGSILTTAAGSTFTLMDRLAYALKKGIALSNNISGLVINLIRKVMAMLGMKPVLDKVDATQSFIRGIFQQLAQRVSSYCQRVLDSALVKGQTA